jgi:periplasmic divalent cation tolerance protein
MNDQAVVVFITAPSLEVGQKLAHTLVEEKLAACVNLLPPVQSIYSWEGEIQTEEEILLVVKTRAELFESRLVPAVKALHPYQVPEVIALPVTSGSQSYLDWIRAETS